MHSETKVRLCMLHSNCGLGNSKLCLENKTYSQMGRGKQKFVSGSHSIICVYVSVLVTDCSIFLSSCSWYSQSFGMSVCAWRGMCVMAIYFEVFLTHS